MYNQWALQQVAAIQFAALQQQQLQQRYLAQNALAIASPLVAQNNVSDDDVSDDEDDEQKRTLFCANLDDRVTEELLYEVFLQAGPIETVRIPKDNTGRQRTFGFVTYMHACTAPYAMQLYQGLALFRKSLTIKFQGNNSAPQTPQQRRSLPSDCEVYNRRSGSGGGGNGGSNYDNSSLRSGNYAAFKDLSPTVSNPFKREERSDWTKGRNNETERISKHPSGQSRPHQNTAPYQRRSGGSDSYDRGRERHGNDYQRRHQHSGSNTRSEQRNNNRR